MAQDNATTNADQLVGFVGTFPLHNRYSLANYGEFFVDAFKARREQGDFCEDFCDGLAYQPKRQLVLLLACIWAQLLVETDACSLDRQRLQKAADAAMKLMLQEGIASDPKVLMALLVEHRETFWVQGVLAKVQKVTVGDIAYVAGEMLDGLLRRSAEPTF